MASCGGSRTFYGCFLRGGYITGTPLMKAGAGLGIPVFISLLPFTWDPNTAAPHLTAVLYKSQRSHCRL